jgi:hypothetical protein
MPPPNPNDQSGIREEPLGNLPFAANKIFLKILLVEENPLPKAFVKECQFFLDGQRCQKFEGMESMSPHIPRIALLLLEWKETNGADFRTSLPPWKELGDLLRGFSVPLWMQTCFGSRENFNKLLSRSNGLIHVNESFAKNDVTIDVFSVENVSDERNATLLTSQDAIPILKRIVGFSEEESISSDHEQFINDLVARYLEIPFSPRDTKLVGKGIWLSHLVRLRSTLEVLFGDTRGLLHTLIEESAKPGGGFDRDMVVDFHSQLDSAIARVNAEFSDEAIRLDFDTKKVTNQLAGVKQALDDLQGIFSDLANKLPCQNCEDKKKIDRDSILKEYSPTIKNAISSLHEAAKAAKLGAHGMRADLARIVQSCRATLSNLVKKD